MRRIKLNKSEKTVLRMVADGQGVCPAEYPLHAFNAAVRSLDDKRFVRGAYEEGGGATDVMLTPQGHLYMAENPKLRNPVDWSVIATLIAAVSAIASIVALLMACSHRI